MAQTREKILIEQLYSDYSRLTDRVDCVIEQITQANVRFAELLSVILGTPQIPGVIPELHRIISQILSIQSGLKPLETAFSRAMNGAIPSLIEQINELPQSLAHIPSNAEFQGGLEMLIGGIVQEQIQEARIAGVALASEELTTAARGVIRKECIEALGDPAKLHTELLVAQRSIKALHIEVQQEKQRASALTRYGVSELFIALIAGCVLYPIFMGSL